jgi:hypothetical protein
LPSAKTQKYLGYIGTIGVMTACFGCGLAANNQLRASNVFLIAAWFILVPLFGYLISTRRQMKRVVRTRSARRQEELDALARVLSQEAGVRSQESGDDHIRSVGLDATDDKPLPDSATSANDGT